ncbi:MAG: heme exporter protein CcmD [Gammaproteobacteria bacterium]|jgi:heme exporter protein D
MFNDFNMGKYAVYVWSSYGLALIVLVASYVIPLLQHKKQLRILKRQRRAGRLEQ